MKLLQEIWNALACIGLITVLYLVWFGWQRLKKATNSAKASNQAFLARTVAPSGIKPAEDYGTEAAWPINHPQ